MAKTDSVVGDFGLTPLRLAAYLYEGDITLVEDNEYISGFSGKTVTRSAPLAVGNWVCLYDDAAITYAATGGLPVVKKATGAGATVYVGKLLKIDPAHKKPADTTPVTALATQLSSDLLRVGLIEFPGLVGATDIEVTVPANGGGADSIDIGEVVDVAFDASLHAWVFDGTNGTGAVPAHHIEGSTSVDVTAQVMVFFGIVPVRINA